MNRYTVALAGAATVLLMGTAAMATAAGDAPTTIDACRDIRRGATREHDDMHVRQTGKGAQGAAAQGQDLRAPRIVDDAAERAVEVTDHEQRPALKVWSGRIDRCPYADGRRHCAGEAVCAGAGVAVGWSTGMLGLGVGASAEKSGTTTVMAWMKMSGGAPP